MISKSIRAIALLLLAAMPFSVGVAGAREVLQGETCTLNADQTMSDTLFVLCRSLVIDGTLRANLIGAAGDVTIRGAVEGDVYIAALEFDVYGTIGEDVHFIGGVLALHDGAQFSSANSDLVFAAMSTQLAPQVDLSGSAFGVGYQLLVQGGIAREISFWGSALQIEGRVGGDVDAAVGTGDSSNVSQLQGLVQNVVLVDAGLVIGEQATLGGYLRYTGPSEGVIDGTLAQAAEYTPVQNAPSLTNVEDASSAQRELGTYLLQALREFITLSIIGTVLLLLIPRTLHLPIKSLRARPLSNLAGGLLAFFMSFFIVLVVLLLTLLFAVTLVLLNVNDVALAFVLGVVVGMLNLGLPSVFYFMAIFVSRIVICLAIGRLIVRWLGMAEGTTRSQFVGLYSGIASLSLAIPLPLVGIVLNGVAVFVGLGAILNVILAQLRTMREHAVAPTPIITLDDGAAPLGTDNLPDGFTWWDDTAPRNP
jgi:hypothetical protein